MPITEIVRRETVRVVTELAHRRPLGPEERILRDASGGTPRVVVALTTYPARLHSVTRTVRSLLRQSVLPDAVVVTLSAEQFADHRVPPPLSPYVERGVEVRFDPGDIRSYKKLLPVLEREPDATVVTADDDVFYPREWLADLLDVARSSPGTVIGHRGHRIAGDRTRLTPYAHWRPADTGTESGRVLLTGVGGIAYPPGALDDAVLDRALAMRLCPTADDLWFKAMALRAGTPTRTVSDRHVTFPSVRSAQRTALRRVNVEGRANERQFRAVMDHFDLWDHLDVPARTHPPDSRAGEPSRPAADPRTSSGEGDTTTTRPIGRNTHPHGRP